MNKKQNNILAIVGPTASGKTRLAEKIKDQIENQCDSETVRQWNGKQVELISVDSRQVYTGMDIGTGKDAKIFGTDLTLPDKLFSVAEYCRVIKPHIEKLWQENKLPVLVGGTGLYLKALIDGIETINITPNEDLRKELEKPSVEELQKRLLSMYGYVYKTQKGTKVKELQETLDSRFRGNDMGKCGMNNSDWNNPRRLMRKIEIVSFCQSRVPLCHSGEGRNPDFSVGTGLTTCPWRGSKDPPLRMNKIMIIGLTAPLSTIKKNIEKRVQDRLDKGLLKEIKGLIKEYGWNVVLRNTIAYKEWEDFFNGKITKEAAIERWTLDEVQYAKRQLTWFKKDKRISWMSTDDNLLFNIFKVSDSFHLLDFHG